MSATNAFETACLEHYFNNADHANIGDAAGLQNSATAGSFYISLHTADPGETGTQTSSEAAYTGYARIAVARSGAGWTVSGNGASNAAEIAFGQATGGTIANITHVGCGTDLSGAGNLLFSLVLDDVIPGTVGMQPIFSVGELEFTAD